MTLWNGIAAITVLATLVTAVGEQPRQTRQAYLDLAKVAYRKDREACRAEVAQWVKSYRPHPLWGYAPPGRPVWLAGCILPQWSRPRYHIDDTRTVA